jgi:hypothetical protein
LVGDGAGEGGSFGASVKGRGGFDEGDPGLFGGRGVVADATRDNEELAGVQRHGAAVCFGAADAEETTQDEEHLILVLMGVPGNSPSTLATLMY